AWPDGFPARGPLDAGDRGGTASEPNGASVVRADVPARGARVTHPAGRARRREGELGSVRGVVSAEGARSAARSAAPAHGGVVAWGRGSTPTVPGRRLRPGAASQRGRAAPEGGPGWGSTSAWQVDDDAAHPLVRRPHRAVGGDEPHPLVRFGRSDRRRVSVGEDQHAVEGFVVV